MDKTVALITAVVGLLVAGSAQAAQLEARAANSIKLGDVVGTAYYTVEEGGYQVVATLAAAENATPVRVTATLLAGQKTVLSVPRGPGESAHTLEIERIGDRVFVNESVKLTGVSN